MEDESSNRPLDTSGFMRALDRIFADRLYQLEKQLRRLEGTTQEDLKGLKEQVSNWVSVGTIELHDLKLEIRALTEKQEELSPVFKSVHRIFSFTMGVKWLFVLVVAVLAAVGTFSTAVETLKKWFH